jgi:hypothetical protein
MSEGIGLSFAGDVRVDHVSVRSANGNEQNITGQVIGIELYEDLFSPFISGKIVVKDAVDLANFFPLIGEEVIQITFTTPSIGDKYAYSGEYYIYKADGRVKLSERQVVYVLNFISKEAIADVNKKISKTYQGKVSDLATQILKGVEALNTDKPINIEDTSNSTKYISNFWSPIRCLNYLAENATNINGSPSYVFFENKNGFNFISLESLYSGLPVYQEFRWDNYSADIGKTGGSVRNLDSDYKRVLEFKTPVMYDYISRVSTGFYGSQMVHYDLTSKKVTHVGYFPDFNKDKHLNKFPMWTEDVLAQPRAVLLHEHKYLNNFEGYSDVTNTKTIQRRLQLLAAADAFKLQITVFGRSDYSVGQKIYLEVPMHAQLKETMPAQSFIDDVYSGNYLVTAINHQITRDRHECTMEIIKDSYIIDLNNPKA